VIAELVKSDYNTIKMINPAIKRFCTPPGVKDFTLNIPVGTKDLFKQEFAKLPDNKKRFYVRHKIRSGETISQIAEKYHTSISVVKSYNKIRGSFIRAGSYLVIPAPKDFKNYKSYTTTVRKRKSKQVKRITNVPGHKKITYIVKNGDTLGDIAENYNTLARKIRSWNGLRYGQYIYPNQKLTLWIPENQDSNSGSSFDKTLSKEIDTKNAEYYVVKRGDTLWDIARKHNVSVNEIRKLNNMKSDKIKPGNRLIVRMNAGS